MLHTTSTTPASLRFLRGVGAFVLGVMLLLPGAAAQDGGLDAQRAEVEAADAAYHALVDRFDDELARYQERTRAIEAFRVDMNGAFDVYELRAALRDAQEAGEALSALDRQVAAARRTVEAAEARLVGALREEVERLNAALRSGEGDPGEVVAQLNRLSIEIGERAAPLPAYMPVPIEDIVRGVADTPEEMYDAAAELLDHEARLERHLEEIRGRLRDAQARNRAISAAGEFRAEESLLDESGSRRAGARATSGGTAVPTSGDRQDDAAEEPTVNAGGETGGLEGDEPTNDAEAPAPGAGMDGDDFGMPPGRGDDFSGGAGDPVETPGEADGGDPVEFGAAGELDAPPGVVGVPVSDRADADPTVIDAPNERRRGRSIEVDLLREREEALLRELEALRDRRERLTEQARALESLD